MILDIKDVKYQCSLKMNKKSGFTLLEVLIATALMVSVLGALVYALNQCSNLTQTVRSQDLALNILQQKLEEIANSDIGQIISNYNGHTFTVDGLTNPVDPQGQPIDHGQVTVTSVGVGDLYEVTATVSWLEKGNRQMSRSIETSFGER